jgi:hypothetical protein
VNAAITLLQEQIAVLRWRLSNTPSREEAEAITRALVEFGDALDVLRGAT